MSISGEKLAVRKEHQLARTRWGACGELAIAQLASADAGSTVNTGRALWLAAGVAARVCSRLWTMTGGWRGGSDGCLRCAFVRVSGVGDVKDKRINMLELILTEFVRWL